METNNICKRLLKTWCDALLETQITEKSAGNMYGGLFCRACGYVHGRISDSIYPFIALYAHTGEEKYLLCAEKMFDWTQKNVRKNTGYNVNDTFLCWHGVTEFYLIALGETILDYGEKLPHDTLLKWKDDFVKTAVQVENDKLYIMNPGSGLAVNYGVAYLTAMAVAYKVTGEEHYKNSAKAQEENVLGYITENGWLFGEGGGKITTPKGFHNIDAGYNFEESVANIALYAHLMQNQVFTDVAVNMLRELSKLMLENGAFDNTWGSRAIKWTYYGSRTTDGVYTACALLQKYDATFALMAQKSVGLMEKLTYNGLLAGGAMYDSADMLPCAHHALTHAKSIAHVFKYPITDTTEPIKTDKIYNIDDAGVIIVNEGNFRATFINNDLALAAHPEITGGTLSLLHHKKAGTILVSNGFKFELSEPTNMQIGPDLDGICQTLRIQSGSQTSMLCKDAQVCINTDDGVKYISKGKLTTLSGITGKEYSIKYTLLSDELNINVCCEGENELYIPIVALPEAKIELNDRVCKIKTDTAEIVVTSDAPLEMQQGFYKNRIFNPTGGFCTLPLRTKFFGNVKVKISAE